MYIYKLPVSVVVFKNKTNSDVRSVKSVAKNETANIK